MKKLIFTIALASLISCSKPELPTEETQATYCGSVNGLQSEYQTTPTVLFFGIRYFVTLETPVTIGATTYTKGTFVLNDALNTPTTEQYTIHNYVCSNAMTLIP